MSASPRLLSYAHGVGAEPLSGDSIGQNFWRSVERFGPREALVVAHQGFRATYAELGGLVERAAKGLLALNVQPGDRVGIWSPNRFEWVVAQYAALSVGAILVNVNPSYRARELEYALNQSGVSVLLHARAFRDLDFVAMLSEVRERCSALRHGIVFESQWQAFMAAGDGMASSQLHDRLQAIQPDDDANIQYTSGTTGQPKGATLSHHNLLNNAVLSAQAMSYGMEDRVCVPVPFYHCFGMVMGTIACVAMGACMVIPAEAFDAVSTLQAVQDERCTSLYGVPTMFLAQLDHPRFGEFAVSTLRTGCIAGSLVPAPLMKRMMNHMHLHGAVILYGMTETSPVSTLTTPEDSFEQRVGTVGRPLAHVEVRIVDPSSGHTVPRGETGEFCARGFHVMKGYWNNADATRATIDADGWLHSGDLAVMDDSGHVRIVGRIKDMIIRGGENLYPREIEDVLISHPAVSDAHVIGIPDSRLGEAVMAWVRLKPDRSASEAQLGAHCAAVLARYKIPKIWRFVDGFPLTVTGKVQKFRLREMAVAELRLDSSTSIHANDA